MNNPDTVAHEILENIAGMKSDSRSELAKAIIFGNNCDLTRGIECGTLDVPPTDPKALKQFETALGITHNFMEDIWK